MCGGGPEEYGGYGGCGDGLREGSPDLCLSICLFIVSMYLDVNTVQVQVNVWRKMAKKRKVKI